MEQIGFVSVPQQRGGIHRHTPVLCRGLQRSGAGLLRAWKCSVCLHAGFGVKRAHRRGLLSTPYTRGYSFLQLPWRLNPVRIQCGLWDLGDTTGISGEVVWTWSRLAPSIPTVLYLSGFPPQLGIRVGASPGL